MYYDRVSELTGTVKSLAAKKLNASDTDKIQFAEYSWNSGFCETCSYEEFDFQVLLNGEAVFDSKGSKFRYGSSSVFANFQDWLDSA